MSPYLVGREDNGYGLRLALRRELYAVFSELGALRGDWGWLKRAKTDPSENSFLKSRIILYRKTGANRNMKYLVLLIMLVGLSGCGAEYHRREIGIQYETHSPAGMVPNEPTLSLRWYW